MTQAKAFLADSKVQNATQELLNSLKEHQSHLTGVREPQSELKQEYEALLQQFQEDRGGKLALPYLGSGFGHGPLVELADGSVKFDFIIGIGVHFFGHSHLGLTETCLKAAFSDTVMQGNLQQDLESAALCRTLIHAAQQNGSLLEHCLLTTSGVMAGENAFKMAFQKKSPAKRILCQNGCFMGRTLLMSNTTDNPKYREGLPRIVDVDYVPLFDPENPEKSIEQAVSVLKDHLEQHPNQYAAMSFELVIGEGGFYPGHKDYFVALMSLLKQHDIPILVDEVQSFARTHQLFAFQHYQLDEYIDAVWIGKASQVCATLFTNKMKPKPGLLSQTYTGSSTAIAAGHYIIQELLNGNYYGPDGKIAKLHQHFKEKLQDLAQKYPEDVTGPYGLGAMVAFTPFAGDPDKVKSFLKILYNNGVIAFMCGKSPLRVRFLLPVGAIETNHIDQVMTIVEQSLIEAKESF